MSLIRRHFLSFRNCLHNESISRPTYFAEIISLHVPRNIKMIKVKVRKSRGKEGKVFKVNEMNVLIASTSKKGRKKIIFGRRSTSLMYISQRRQDWNHNQENKRKKLTFWLMSDNCLNIFSRSSPFACKSFYTSHTWRRLKGEIYILHITSSSRHPSDAEIALICSSWALLKQETLHVIASDGVYIDSAGKTSLSTRNVPCCRSHSFDCFHSMETLHNLHIYPHFSLFFQS